MTVAVFVAVVLAVGVKVVAVLSRPRDADRVSNSWLDEHVRGRRD